MWTPFLTSAGPQEPELLGNLAQQSSQRRAKKRLSARLAMLRQRERRTFKTTLGCPAMPTSPEAFSSPSAMKKRILLPETEFKQSEEKSARQRTTPHRMVFQEGESEDDGDLIIAFGPEEDEALKLFDLDTKYGPCIGLSRKQRWNRANRYGLAPPAKVRELLELLDANDERQHALWHNNPLL